MNSGIQLDDEKLAVFENVLPTMAEFRHVFGIELKPASVGELHAARVLRLELSTYATQQGYDALAPDGTRCQIKYHADETHHVLINNFDFDYFVLVNLDADYQPSGIWRITVEQAREISTEQSGKFGATQQRVQRIGERIL